MALIGPSRDILLGYLALLPAHPVHLAGTELPLVSDNSLELGFGQAWRESPTYELQSRLGSLGPAGCLRRSILLEDCDRHDAVKARLGRHFGALICGDGKDVGGGLGNGAHKPCV
jgi:hypothetical protein